MAVFTAFWLKTPLKACGLK